MWWNIDNWFFILKWFSFLNVFKNPKINHIDGSNTYSPKWNQLINPKVFMSDKASLTDSITMTIEKKNAYHRQQEQLAAARHLLWAVYPQLHLCPKLSNNSICRIVSKWQQFFVFFVRGKFFHCSTSGALMMMIMMMAHSIRRDIWYPFSLSTNRLTASINSIGTLHKKWILSKCLEIGVEFLFNLQVNFQPYLESLQNYYLPTT